MGPGSQASVLRARCSTARRCRTRPLLNVGLTGRPPSGAGRRTPARAEHNQSQNGNSDHGRRRQPPRGEPTDISEGEALESAVADLFSEYDNEGQRGAAASAAGSLDNTRGSADYPDAEAEEAAFFAASAERFSPTQPRASQQPVNGSAGVSSSPLPPRPSGGSRSMSIRGIGSKGRAYVTGSWDFPSSGDVPYGGAGVGAGGMQASNGVSSVDDNMAAASSAQRAADDISVQRISQQAPGQARPKQGKAAAGQTLKQRTFLNASKPAGRPDYKPRTALSLARRRMLGKYLPFEWQLGLRKQAEDIPEQQFNYLVSTIVIVSTSILTGFAAYSIWPAARAGIIWLFSADAVEARVLQELTFETQYLSAISLVTAILLGNTFAFSFDRQRQIIAEISEEIFALELLLQELFIEIREPHLRWRVIKHIKRYIDDEIQARNIDSPFRVDGAIMGLFNALLTLKEDGKNITKMIASVELLAQANSRRGALAAALLPPLHWVMLDSLCILLLSAFLLFDSDFSNPVTENRTIFTVLTGMLATILQVLQDISVPDDGLYSVRDAMENRLSYVRWQMDNILSDPAIKVSMLGKENDNEHDEAEGQGAGGDAERNPSGEPSWMKE